MAADRSGASKLKEGISAEDIAHGGVSTNGSTVGSPRVSPQEITYDAEEDGDDEEEYEEEEEEDDFLARDLEEWG